MALQKQYTIKLFDQDGTTFVTNIAPDEIVGVPTFTSRINGGFSEMVVTIRGSRFTHDQNWGEGDELDFMNIGQLEVVDINNPRGRTIYKGWLSQIEPVYNALGDQFVKVTFMHLSSLLSASYYKNVASYTVSHATDDAETIGRAIIDHFNTIFGGSLLSYSGDTTDPVGVNLTHDFVDKKWFDALKKVGEFAGDDWWWKIDETGQYWLKPKPSTPTHTFTINKDLEVLRASKSAERIVNDVQMRYTGGGTYNASDSASQAEFGTGSGPATGKWSKILSDSDVQNATTAQAEADKYVNDNKDAKIMATLTINNEYDLESIKVGETCRIRNLDYDNSFFNSNMLIAQVQYKGEKVVLSLSDEPFSFAKELDEFVNG